MSAAHLGRDEGWGLQHAENGKAACPDPAMLLDSSRPGAVGGEPGLLCDGQLLT